MQTFMRGLEGKNVLVTGGSSGIGQAIAVRFAEHGANVAINLSAVSVNAHTNPAFLHHQLQYNIAVRPADEARWTVQ